MNDVTEGRTSPAPLPLTETSDFDAIIAPVIETGLATPCEVQAEELCGLAPRLAHFVISFVECGCDERRVTAVCEPCMSHILEWDFAWCPDCQGTWSPYGEALQSVARIRS